MRHDVGGADRAQLVAGHRVHRLAVIRFGADTPTPVSGAWLDVRIPNERLVAHPDEELVPAAGPVALLEIDGAPCAADDRSLYVSMEGEADPAAPLDTLARALYGRLLRGVTRAGYPHLLRVWNYVPRIHDRSSGIERYMSFQTRSRCG